VPTQTLGNIHGRGRPEGSSVRVEDSPRSRDHCARVETPKFLSQSSFLLSKQCAGGRGKNDRHEMTDKRRTQQNKSLRRKQRSNIPFTLSHIISITVTGKT